MADNNSKKPMALLLLVVVAVLVVILMTPPLNCTVESCKGDNTLTTQTACEEAGKTWETKEIHVSNSDDCNGIYWDFNTQAGCEAAGKTWTAEVPADLTSDPPVEAQNAECN